MYNVYFQVHGSPEVQVVFFQGNFFATSWMDHHREKFSMCWLEEIFH